MKLSWSSPLPPLYSFIADMDINYPVLLGNEGVIKAYRIRHIPTTIVVDKKGVIKERLIGFSDSLMKRLREKIEELL